MSGFTLDAGALIALERGDRRVVRMLARALETGRRVTIPSTVLAQVVRAPASQVGVMRLVGRASTVVADLDRPTAVAVGRLLAATSTADVVDGHVAVVAVTAGDAIVTSDPDDLRRLAPGTTIVEI